MRCHFYVTKLTRNHMKYSVTKFRSNTPYSQRLTFLVVLTNILYCRHFSSVNTAAAASDCILHFALATFRLQKDSAEIISIAFCDEWNLALTGLKLIYFGQSLSAADCLHVGPAFGIIWRLCAHFLSLYIYIHTYTYIYIYVYTYIALGQTDFDIMGKYWYNIIF
jgi:hypothetical protein